MILSMKTLEQKRSVTGLACGGAFGPMLWGTGPCIPPAMGTRWPVNGPRASIALGSRPAPTQSSPAMNEAPDPRGDERVQLPLVSIGGPRGSIIGGPLGSPIMFRGSPMCGPLMSIGAPLISGRGPLVIWPMWTGAWWGGGAPM